MKRFIFNVLLVIVSPLLSYSQDAKTPIENPLEQLNFMIGTWEGDSWMMTENGKSSSKIKETVNCKLDCNILVAEGLGTKIDPETNEVKIVHNAFGVIFYDKISQSLMLRAYKDGNETTSKIELVEAKKIRWFLEIPNGSKVRFTSDYSEENKWIETGEFSRDGKNYNTFMEMNLIRVKP